MCVDDANARLLVSKTPATSSVWTLFNGVNVTLVASRFVNCSLTPLAMVNSRMVQADLLDSTEQ